MGRRGNGEPNGSASSQERASEGLGMPGKRRFLPETGHFRLVAGKGAFLQWLEMNPLRLERVLQ